MFNSLSSDAVVNLHALSTQNDLEYIAPRLIERDPQQPRQLSDEYELTEAHHEMKASIKEHGVLQPIRVRPITYNADGTPLTYRLIFGERRWRACKALRMDVPAIVEANASDLDALRMQILENEQREDLSDVDRASGYKRYRELKVKINPRVKWAEIAKELGMTPEHMSRLLALLKLPPDIQDDIRKGEITTRQARGLTLIPGNPDAQRQLAQRAKTEKLSGDAVAKEAQQIRQTTASQNTSTRSVTIGRTEPARPDHAATLARWNKEGLEMAANLEADKPAPLLQKELQRQMETFQSTLSRIEAACAEKARRRSA